MAKVSVIIPVYGVEKYIEKCARQLFEQTLDDVEYLFIDDCTPDKSVEVLRQVLNDYPHRKGQVVIHRMEHNSGQAKVREWGMKHASGEYLIHCDTDDWPENNQYAELYNAAVKESADLVFCDYYRVYPNGDRVYNCKNLNFEDKRELLIRMLSGYYDANQLWSCLMKRELTQEIIYPDGNQGEDRVIMFQAIKESSHIIYIKKALYNYFINPESLQRTVKPEKLIERTLDSASNVKLIIRCMDTYNFSDIPEDSIVAFKFKTRVLLSIGLYDKRCRKLWYQLFPEINNKILKNKYISKISKVKEIIMRAHLGVIYGFIYYVIVKVVR